jgi:hypothetical protein
MVNIIEDPFFTYDFPSGAGNMEGDPPLMTGWKVISLLSHAVICMLQQGSKHAPHKRPEGNIKNDLLPMAWPGPS